MSFSFPCSIMRMLVKRSTTSPSRRLSSSGRAKFFGRISFSRLFSFSMARMASSIAVPISCVCALSLMSSHRAPCGTKKIPSEVYSSISSSKPSPSATSSRCFSSNRSEMYLRKIRPNTTFLYSDASILPRSTHAAFQICFSKPISALFPLAIERIPSFIILPYYRGKLDKSNQHFPLAVSLTTFTADIVFILQRFHNSLDRSNGFSGLFRNFLLFYRRVFRDQF